MQVKCMSRACAFKATELDDLSVAGPRTLAPAEELIQYQLRIVLSPLRRQWVKIFKGFAMGPTRKSSQAKVLKPFPCRPKNSKKLLTSTSIGENQQRRSNILVS